MTLVSRLLATGFGVGYIPVAPGTFGSIVGLFLYLAIPHSDSALFVIVLAILLCLGTWSARRYENETGVKDNQEIVVDEIVGVLVSVYLVEKDPLWLCLGLFYFRLFDIWKPPPIRFFERAPAGWGVMLDDVMAGIYAWAALRLTIELGNRFL